MKLITYGLTTLIVLGSELTLDNYDEKTMGKTVCIKFFLQSCHFCKAFEPVWNRLVKTFENSPTALLAEVDCEGAGKDLCADIGIENYPELRYGDPQMLEIYHGELGYDELLLWAGRNIAAFCSPKNLDLCNAEQKEKIDTMHKQGIEKLEAKLVEFEYDMQSKESKFEAKVEGLYEGYEKKYNKLLKDKEKGLKAVRKKNDYWLLKLVLAHLQSPLEDRKESETATGYSL